MNKRKDYIVIIVLISLFSLLITPTIISCENENGLENVDAETKNNRAKLYSPLDIFALPENKEYVHELAEAYDVKLVDGESIRLIVEIDENQFEAAIEACSTLGTIEGISERGGWIQVVLPVKQLNNLAEESSVNNIRLPRKFVTN